MQKQRGIEREIRDKKRDIYNAELAGADVTQFLLELGKQQSRLKAHTEKYSLIREPKREKAYGITRQPRGLRGSVPKDRIATLSLGRENISGGIPSLSSLAATKDFDDLQSATEAKWGIRIDDGLKELHFESIRSFIAGMDDIVSDFPKTASVIRSVRPGATGRTIAEVGQDGKVFLNRKEFAILNRAAADSGRHEGGHLLEVTLVNNLKNGQAAAWDSGKEARRILEQARKELQEITGVKYRLDKLIDGVSSYPAERWRVTRNQGDFWSEGLSEAVRSWYNGSKKNDSFVNAVMQVLRRGLL